MQITRRLAVAATGAVLALGGTGAALAAGAGKKEGDAMKHGGAMKHDDMKGAPGAMSHSSTAMAHTAG